MKNKILNVVIVLLILVCSVLLTVLVYKNFINKDSETNNGSVVDVNKIGTSIEGVRDSIEYKEDFDESNSYNSFNQTEQPEQFDEQKESEETVETENSVTDTTDLYSVNNEDLLVDDIFITEDITDNSKAIITNDMSHDRLESAVDVSDSAHEVLLKIPTNLWGNFMLLLSKFSGQFNVNSIDIEFDYVNIKKGGDWYMAYFSNNDVRYTLCVYFDIENGGEYGYITEGYQ